jgi:hypothetical protein
MKEGGGAELPHSLALVRCWAIENCRPPSLTPQKLRVRNECTSRDERYLGKVARTHTKEKKIAVKINALRPSHDHLGNNSWCKTLCDFQSGPTL